MAGIRHAKVSTVADEAGNPDEVKPSDWNTDHAIDDDGIPQAKVASLVTDLAAKQPLAALLTALAALDATAGILRQTGAGAVTRIIDTAAGRALLEALDAAAQRVALGLGTAATTAATDYATAAHGHGGVYQPLAAALTALAALGTAADKLPYATGVGTFAEADLTAFARTLLAVANAAAARSTLGLGTAATADTGTGAANVLTTAAADARYASATTTMTIGLAVALAAGVVTP